MMAILAEVAPVGANLVSLHAQAYEKIRTETGLPARLRNARLARPRRHAADAAVRNPARRQVVRDQGTNFTDH